MPSLPQGYFQGRARVLGINCLALNTYSLSVSLDAPWRDCKHTCQQHSLQRACLLSGPCLVTVCIHDRTAGLPEALLCPRLQGNSSLWSPLPLRVRMPHDRTDSLAPGPALALPPTVSLCRLLFCCCTFTCALRQQEVF